MRSDSAALKRDEIVRLAYEVFDAHGFRETGIDRLLADSGISKRTVYKYFRSKEELIAAAVAYYQHKTFTNTKEELERRAPDAKGRLLALFDLKSEELECEDYSGCFAINAQLVYEGRNEEIKEACATFLRDMQEFVTGLCREAGCASPDATATQIMVLFEGTILHGQSQRKPEVARLSREIVRSLLG
jgi:AcrR family transcriptional regulator